jgi:membrane-bound lytic murein transglycosylase D
MTYKVRSGDTLSEIAEKFNVSVRQLMTWNQLRSSSTLRAGQRIVVYVDPRRVNGG